MDVPLGPAQRAMVRVVVISFVLEGIVACRWTAAMVAASGLSVVNPVWQLRFQGRRVFVELLVIDSSTHRVSRRTDNHVAEGLPGVVDNCKQVASIHRKALLFRCDYLDFCRLDAFGMNLDWLSPTFVAFQKVRIVPNAFF